MDKHKLTVADIFRQGFEQYVQKHGPLPQQYYKIAHAIMSCRTHELGGHQYQCTNCSHEITLCNSCGNRHCPNCQTYARVQWINDRIEELLPVPYFHGVFTVPQQLNAFALRNKKAFYAIMFRSVKETLLELAWDQKRLGAHIGFICVLHTWGQNLMDHPHIHVIIPAGGLDKSKRKWISCRKDFLFPISVIQKLYRGKMMAYFRRYVDAGEIQFHGMLKMYENKQGYQDLLNTLYQQKWVVYLKESFVSSQSVIKYLGNYTHRIAISNNRLVKLENGRVSFRYKDYADGNKQKCMTVTVTEFIRRFLMHVIPNGFMRIRHYGFLSNRCKEKILALCRKLLGKKDVLKRRKWKQIIKKLTGNPIDQCTICKIGKMIQKQMIPPGNPILSLLSG